MNPRDTHYDIYGRETAKTDIYGDTIRLTYNTKGQVHKIIEAGDSESSPTKEFLPVQKLPHTKADSRK